MLATILHVARLPLLLLVRARTYPNKTRVTVARTTLDALRHEVGLACRFNVGKPHSLSLRMNQKCTSHNQQNGLDGNPCVTVSLFGDSR